jgi:hypothetical protein
LDKDRGQHGGGCETVADLTGVWHETEGLVSEVVLKTDVESTYSLMELALDVGRLVLCAGSYSERSTFGAKGRGPCVRRSKNLRTLTTLNRRLFSQRSRLQFSTWRPKRAWALAAIPIASAPRVLLTWALLLKYVELWKFTTQPMNAMTVMDGICLYLAWLTILLIVLAGD